MAALLKVALAQYPCGGEPGAILARAKEQHAEIVVFPEMFSNGHSTFDPSDAISRANWQQSAAQLDGAYVDRFRQAARAHEIYAVATLLEAADPKPFNSALLITPQGETVLHHRKVYICDFDAPELACDRGHEFSATDIQTSAGPVRVGMMICMDREFPQGGKIAFSRGRRDRVNSQLLHAVHRQKSLGRPYRAGPRPSVRNGDGARRGKLSCASRRRPLVCRRSERYRYR